MLSEFISFATTLSKNTKLNLSGKPAAVSICFLGGVAGVCYITHEVLQYKKESTIVPEREHHTRQTQLTDHTSELKSVTEYSE